MKQNGLTILSRIDPARLDDLDRLLRKLGDDVARQTSLPFQDLNLLHYASWTIFPDSKYGPQLVFESNFDGAPEEFLLQIATVARKGLDDIYAFCPDFPLDGDTDAVVDYFHRHTVNTHTFFVSCGGFTRRQILDEQNLRDKVETFLGEHPRGSDAAAIRRDIQDLVRRDPDLQWALAPPEPYTFFDRLKPRDVLLAAIVLVSILAVLLGGGLIGLGLLGGAVILTLLVVYMVLRMHERTDPSVTDMPVEDVIPSHKDVHEVAHREDRRPQNHLASVTLVKPGLFRFLLLKTVLAGIELIARHCYYKGKLGEIPSIHFARWAMINRGEHLLFLSNFDGSWEHYLGEFIDQAAGGLTAVWSNCVNFPRSKGLIGGGAADEQRFKAYARKAQFYSQLWYSAYPYLSVVNIQNNAAIRKGLWEEMRDPKEIQAWLRRF